MLTLFRHGGWKRFSPRVKIINARKLISHLSSHWFWPEDIYFSWLDSAVSIWLLIGITVPCIVYSIRNLMAMNCLSTREYIIIIKTKMQFYHLKIYLDSFLFSTSSIKKKFILQNQCLTNQRYSLPLVWNYFNFQNINALFFCLNLKLLEQHSNYVISNIELTMML